MGRFNPLRATESIKEEYFEFFLTSFAPNNENLQKTLREQIPGKYLWRGPYVSIPLPIKQGKTFDEYENGRINQVVKKAFPHIKRLYVHQERAISKILDGKNTIAAVPTGSGKTEIFMIPILQYCYEQRGKKGVKAILIYPMNALVKDQVERLRKVLWIINRDLSENEKITFGVYTGDTPEKADGLKVFEKFSENCFLTPEDRAIYNCPEHCDRRQIKYSSEKEILYCPLNKNIKYLYQILTRESIRKSPPDILLTNYVQLEHILTRKKDSAWLDEKKVRYVVLDEIHTYTGSKGIDIAFLMRRLKDRIGEDIICIGTSATLSSSQEEHERRKKISEFANRIFGSPFNLEDIVEAEFEEYNLPPPNQLRNLEVITEVERLNSDELIEHKTFINILKKISPNYKYVSEILNDGESLRMAVSKALLQNPLFQFLIIELQKPQSLDEIIDKIYKNPSLSELILSKEDLKDVVWSYLKLGSVLPNPQNPTLPLINVTVHNFFKTIERLYKCSNLTCNRIFTSPREHCESCRSSVDELGVCRFCGHEFGIIYVDENEFQEFSRDYINTKNISKIKKYYSISNDIVCTKSLKKLDYSSEYSISSIPLWISYDSPPFSDEYIKIKKCTKCGSILSIKENNCIFCKSNKLNEAFLYIRLKFKEINGKEIKDTRFLDCPFCGNRYGLYSALTPVYMSPDTASTVVFDKVYGVLPEKFKKLLIFTDNRQIASYLAKRLEDTHLDHTLRSLIYNKISSHPEQKLRLPEVLEKILYETIDDWYRGSSEKDTIRKWIRYKILEEVCSKSAQRSLESLGLIEVTYSGLENEELFSKKWKEFVSKKEGVTEKDNASKWMSYLISLLHIIRHDGALKGLHRTPLTRDEVVCYHFNVNLEQSEKNRIRVQNLLKKRLSKSLTSKFFNVTRKEDIEKILKTSFEFLQFIYILIKDKVKFYEEEFEGYIIDYDKIIIKIPSFIFRCKKCKRIFTVVPPSKICPRYSCDGEVEFINFEEYKNSNTNYYFHFYQKNLPIKMSTAEDTGAIPLDERHEIETEFKRNEVEGRKYDVIVSTPTLELGIDIGDLISVGLYKAPPSPASYIQRVGRAGRKERTAFNNTFLYPSPIDRYYYEHPEELIRGEFDAPKVDITNPYILQKHFNAIIAEMLFVHSNTIYPTKMTDFADEVFKNMLKEINIYKSKIIEKINRVFKDVPYPHLTDQKILKMIEIFEEQISDALKRFNCEIKTYRNYQNYFSQQRNWDKVKRLDELIKKLEEVPIISYLMDVNVLPRYAFPGIYVEIRDINEYESFESRSRSIAITECAPRMRIFLKKKVYKSIGVDMEVLKPNQQIFYICPKCERLITTNLNELTPKCSMCGEINRKEEVESRRVEAIEPNIIYIQKIPENIFELRFMQEAVGSIFLNEGPKSFRKSNFDPNLELVDYGNVELIKIVDKVIINGEEMPIELCERCGKVKEKLSENKHRRVGGERKEFCYGKFIKNALYHRMPTNVISIRLSSSTDKILGVELNDKNMKIFLTTLKNAIINAAQKILFAQDGEIDGDVKTNDKEIILYDNVDGGVGYVSQIIEKFEEVMLTAAEMILSCDCEIGCPNCLWSYRRQRDIPNIDKRIILPALKLIKERERNVPNKLPAYFNCKNVKTIVSDAYSFEGVLQLKSLLKNAQEKIYLTSLYVTDDKLPWPDETPASWVDILSNIKHLKKDIEINVITKEPRIPKHRESLHKLVQNKVEVYIYKKESENKLPGIIHSKIILIDPHIPSKRSVVFTSGNFSPEMWKNHETFHFSTDEECVKKTYEEIRKLIMGSKKFLIKNYYDGTFTIHR